MATLSKTCESYNFLKLSFTNIWGLHLNFADCESFLESNSPDILPLWETNLDDSIDSANFPVRGYFPLIWKDSSIHMHGLTVYVKEGVPFKWVLSLENSADSYLSFQLVLLHSLSHFSFLFRSPSSFLCAVFGSLSSNFVFGDFITSITRTGLPILMELIDLVNSVIIFLSQMTWLRWLSFLLRSQTVILIDCSFGFLSFLMLVFVLQWLSLHWEILIILLCHFPLTFHQIYNRMSCFITDLAYDYSQADWDDFCNHLRDAPWEDIFKLGSSAAAS